ncbi:MAG: phosphatase PAP2 family protein [Pirellulales bacterium]|nr:phosphatase PAP2 family protein [Pirellulales bacterium]
MNRSNSSEILGCGGWRRDLVEAPTIRRSRRLACVATAFALLVAPAVATTPVDFAVAPLLEVDPDTEGDFHLTFSQDWCADCEFDSSPSDRLESIEFAPYAPGDRLELRDLPTGSPSLWERVVADHRRYYSVENLGWLALGAGVTAGLANSRADDWIGNDWYQESIRNARTDEFYEGIHSMKVFGEGTYALPIYAAAIAGGWWTDGEGAAGEIGEWGDRSFRAVLVGAPPMLAMQRLIGASRPHESSSGSHWQPFQDDNGVSGHSFMGAVPFLTAAQLTENRWLRSGLYAGSTLAGLSRVNDNHHYASQVIMGWWMAYLATRSVAFVDQDFAVQPVLQTSPEGFTGLLFEKRW